MLTQLPLSQAMFLMNFLQTGIAWGTMKNVVTSMMLLNSSWIVTETICAAGNPAPGSKQS